jgi:hypothetical protein
MSPKAAEQFRVCRALRCIPGKYDQINGRQLGATDTKAFAHEALQTVAIAGMAHFLPRYGETQAWNIQGVRPVKYREEPVCRTLALAKHAVKVGGAEKSVTSIEALRALVRSPGFGATPAAWFRR